MDRYKALGIPYPDPKTMCLGRCEGTGYVLVNKDEENEMLLEDWKKAESANPSDDGWHFVVCPDCNGSRIRMTPEEMKAREDEIANEMSASEALFAFAAWLTVRDRRVTFSSVDGAALAADLVEKFIQVNKLAVPRTDFTKRFTMPEQDYFSPFEDENDIIKVDRNAHPVDMEEIP